MSFRLSSSFRSVLVATSMLLGGVVAFAGCDSVSSDSGGNGDGRVRVLLTDAPFPYDLVDEARVTISRVELVRLDGNASGRVIVLSDDDQTFNLLDLQNGVTAEIGEDDLEPGLYSHAQLVVDDAVLIMKDGERHNLKVPSGRIKILLPDFRVDEDEVSVVTLDFDVQRSFVTRGNIEAPGFKGFIFKPVIKPISIQIGDDDRDVDVDFDDDLEVRGAIQALSAASLTVEGFEFLINTQTEFDDLSGLAALVLGDLVEVEYHVDDDGTLIATEISRVNDDELDDLFEVEGDVTAVTEQSLTVNGIMFILTNDTRFDDDLDGGAGLTTGIRVELKYRIGPQGDLEVVHVEREDG